MRIGLLTSGDDCPGLNAVIRAAVLHGINAYGPEKIAVMLERHHIDAIVAIGGERALAGAKRLGGVGEYVTAHIEAATGIETRNTTLGHIQRGGAPTGFDRVLATRFGMAVVDLVHDKQWGRMVSLRGTDMVRVDFGEAPEGIKTVPQHRWDEDHVLFGRCLRRP